MLSLKGLGTDLTTDCVLKRVAQGDPAGVDDCIEQFGGLVWSLARQLCPDRSEAEDAVQEIFVSVWKSAARYDETMGSQATFIATIARRRLIDRARKRNRRLGAASLDESYAVPATSQDDQRATPRAVSEDAMIAERALRDLSDDQQQVIRMSIMHGLSHEQIARSTGMPLGTVKTHIRRGLIRVRKALQTESAAHDASRDREVKA